MRIGDQGDAQTVERLAGVDVAEHVRLPDPLAPDVAAALADAEERRRGVEERARAFWDEIAAESETKARVVEIFKRYNDVMAKAGRPYRYS